MITAENISAEDRKFARRTLFFMHVIMFFKVFGFLALSESGGVNKAFKVVVSLLMTLFILIVTRKMIRKNYHFEFAYTQQLVLIFYVGYLLLGTISITWAADKIFAVIQIFRDLDLFIFSILFIRAMRAYNKEHGTTYDLSYFFVYTVFLNALYFFHGHFADPDKFMRLTHGGTVARLGGLIMNPNELGMLCSFGGACVLLQLPLAKRKFILIVILGIDLYTMFLTGSRSSSIGFVLVAGTYAMLSDNKTLKGLMIAGIVIAGPFVAKEVVFSEEKGGAEEVMSMTGRLPFWKALLTEALWKEPLLGYGFMNIYYTKYFQGKNTYPASMTHNTFVQVIMNLGLIGSTIVLFQMVFVFRALFSERSKQEQKVFLLLFIPIFINSITEFGIWGETNYGVLFYQILFLTLVIKNHEYFEGIKHVQIIPLRRAKNFDKHSKISD